ncbi:MAG: hypothetical protein H8D23_09450 [Candidatus Brocadiales bacterium]|nr:hypothetical protein [Candidatus Brocadiales bacterium]
MTANLAKRITVKPVSNVKRSQEPHLDWHANMFKLGRSQMIIVTNSVCLVSFVFGGAGMNDPSTFSKQVINHLVDYIRNWNLEEYADMFNKINPEEIVIAKTDDRSVLGSMNDLVWLAKNHQVPGRVYLGDLSYQLNHAPMSMLGGEAPFWRFLNMMEKIQPVSAKVVSMMDWKRQN